MSPAAPSVFQLRRYFSIASGILILGVVFVLAFAYRYSEVHEHTTLAGLRNEMLARTYANYLWPSFGSFLLRADLAPEVRRTHDNTRALDGWIRQMSRDVPVLKIKVYNLDGVVVYSSVLGEIGENKRQNSAFIEASQGRLVNELAHRGTMSATEGQIQNVDVVSTYIPIRPGPEQPIQAVFELYSNVTDTVARIEEITLRLLVTLGAIFLLLYLSLLGVVGRADRIMKRQYAAIKDNEARLESKTTELERQIVERQEVEHALRLSEEHAATANRAKSEFLSGMSHELRTPMNAILGFAQLLDTEPDAPLSTSQRSFLRQILKAGEHLLSLINQVLDLAKIEAGKLTLSIEPVSLAVVLDDALPLVQSLATQRQIAPITPDLHGWRVQADYFRLKQVLLNLLSNAIKYNRSGGRVTVTAAAAGAAVRIEVADTGHGIPEDRLGELFQPFSRLGVQSAEVEGTGIGLALSRQLVESMGGKIGVRSTPGLGSTFWLELPVAAPLLGELADAAKDNAAAAPGGAPAHPDDLKTVLYVEDNPANLMLMEALIGRMSGVRLLSAHNAELGIALAGQEKPDLIILDINLPGMDGFQALTRLRGQSSTQDIPVMAISANAMPKDIDRGGAAGFLYYHTKPIQVDVVMDSIRDTLAGVRA